MAESYQKQPVTRIAAIDIGTNSFHAVIVDVYPDGSFYTVDKLKEMVLLAEKGFDNRLSDAAFERALNALHKIKTLCDHQGAERILAYATSAIREAENGGELIQKVIDDIGIKIIAIPGRVEAELIGLAVQHGIEMSSSPSLLMDLGGGSVEFVIANSEKFFHLSSKKLGVARMTAKFVDNDPISEEEIHKLRDHFSSQLIDVAQAFASNRASTLIGSSGTMENIALMIAYRQGKSPSLSVNELEFTAGEFFELYEEVIGMGYEERRTLKGLDEKRVPLLPAGLVLVNYVLKTFGIKRVKISSQALREGIIIRYINQEMSHLQETEFIESPRRRSVIELVYKCNWDEPHSRHVAKMAVQLFDYFQKEFELEDVDRELLEYACFMHDIGYHISHRKHHKHALYIIRNSDLKGFKENEIEIMANVARYHRRSTPKPRHKHFDKLPKEEKDRVEKLSAIMRIADGLDRSHYQNVQAMTVEKNGDQVLIQIKTESDPQLEIWGAMRKNALFEEVTGRELSIQQVGQLSEALS